MKRAEYSFSTSLDEARKRRYWLTVIEQPMWRYLIARAYHWYDMNGFHVLKHLDRWLKKDDIPLTNRQDIRCYFLHEKHAKKLLHVEITHEQYLEAHTREERDD